MNRLLLTLISLFLIAAAPKRPEIVTITPRPPIEVTARTKIELPIELKILKGYHIQSNPASAPYLIPVTATLEKIDGIEIGKPVFPPGVPFRLKGSQTDISTYEGTVRIKIPVQISASTKPGEVSLKGTLRYQGCDAILCFPPRKLPFEIQLRIKD